MKTYKQLTYEQRCQIEALNKSGMSQLKMSKLVGVSQSALSRELSRNKGQRGYRHKQAHHKALERRGLKAKPSKMTMELREVIKDKLHEKLSPEQISGWLRKEQEIKVSHERIYQHVWQDKKAGGDLYTCLRRQGRKYQSRGSNGKTSRGQIRNRVSIDERPAAVAEKIEVGHWEGDLVIGKNHRGGLVTIVERVTGFTVSQRIESKQAEEVAKTMIALLIPYKKLVKTITLDNGKEFAFHEKVAQQLECDIYFAHPYSSWERGLNENTNGLIRQYFPKKTDFNQVQDEAVSASIQQLNDRPRKRHGFETPAVLMQRKMLALAA